MNQAFVTQLGYEVIGIAKNGAEGYAQYLALKPDIIISDIEMPELDGVGLVKKIRQIDQDEETKIIMISAVANARVVQGLEKLKALIVQKPITQNIIANALKQLK